MLAHQYSWTRALAQTDLNCVLPSTRGSLKRHAVTPPCTSGTPEVQFHRTTTLPGREKIVRSSPDARPLPDWNVAHGVKGWRVMLLIRLVKIIVNGFLGFGQVWIASFVPVRLR